MPSNKCSTFFPYTHIHKRMFPIQITDHWLWGAPSCRCGRCRTVAPTSGPCTRTSPGPRSVLGQSAGKPSRAEWLYLQTGVESIWMNHHKMINICLKVWAGSFTKYSICTQIYLPVFFWLLPQMHYCTWELYLISRRWLWADVTLNADRIGYGGVTFLCVSSMLKIKLLRSMATNS